VIRRNLLSVFILPLTVLAACSAQAGTVMSSSPVVTIPASASLATPVPSSTAAIFPAATATPVATATETLVPPVLPVVASPALVRIDFQDAKNGWGIAVNSNGCVLRTVDGGSTWLNATPPGIGSIGLSATLAVLHTNTVWVLVPGTDFFSGILYRTGNGGITWSSNAVPFGAALIQFQNGDYGRALADRGASAGSEAVELFQTSDGGATWTSIFHDDPGLPGSSDSLPQAGIKNGMTFIDGQTGWVTGFLPADGDVYLYVTHDGGVSWSQQSVPLQAGYEAYQYLPQAPVFFGKDGFLPLTVYQPDTTGLIFYTSHDGGLSWTGNPANADQVIKPGLPAFADARHIWSWDGGTSLYTTNDSTQTWDVTKPTLNLSGNLSQLEFVPGFTGWALTRLDDGGRSHLYRTIDGTIWTPLIP
jgi:photosystem II stability/assembly factor-like uncharacterized protein